MFTSKNKSTRFKYTMAVVLLMVMFISGGLFWRRTIIIAGYFKYKGDGAYKHHIYDDAEVYYKRSLERVPMQPAVRYNLGDAYYQQERYAECIESYLHDLKVDDDSLKALTCTNLGNAYYRQHKLSQSIEAYTNALLIAKDNVKARRNLLFVLSIQNNEKTKIASRTTKRQSIADKKNKTANNNYNTPGDKSNDMSNPKDRQSTEKQINDIFKIVDQKEDDARGRISRLKQAPVKIKGTEADY